mgnify:CR=1 FL=1
MFYRDVLIESRERNAFMSKELQIRNSTVDFLVFTRDAGEDGIEVRVQNGDVWLTQKAISQLFDVDRSVVTKHLSNIFKEGELDENSTCANFARVASSVNSPLCPYGICASAACTIFFLGKRSANFVIYFRLLTE